MMYGYLRFLYREKLYRNLPAEDEFARQQFILFRIFSLTGALVCGGVFAKMKLTIADTSATPWLVLGLGILMLTNYFMVSEVKNLQRAYFIMILSACILLHVVSYDCGGIMTGGSLYWSVVIIYTYLLLGKQTGTCIALLISAHLVYLYLINDSGLTSFALFKNDKDLISQDFLVNGLLMTYLVASLCNYLQSGKNVVVQSLESSKKELERQNKVLEEKNKLLNEYTVKLENSNRELEKFASVAAHDLKAPLRAIGNTIGMIEQDQLSVLPHETQSGFNLIKGRVNRMEGLLNGLLRYAKISRAERDPEIIRLDEIIQKVFLQLNVNATAELAITTGIPLIKSSHKNWQSVFHELILNSLRFGDKEVTQIRVSACTHDDKLILTYCDNGPGIPQRFHEKVFMIFQTLQARDEQESSGIGLALVKKLVETEDGTVSLNEKEHGVEFSITLPSSLLVTNSTVVPFEVQNQ